ncbi:uncharacterized protein RCC_03739 [Ramularia collo-cygni]|uniref:Leucine Rich Repeat domain protein n=1 Tax=Ramularia collo-cygni TaxID=112498 RepID=A0A2D3UNV0_9PEZI|nr:uncharacterized protein RCC_03739 [Ramularia collo-cygni]CZT17902.1 uncharacterized protein RCC_03739 [Ramularia collo-cygni]
MIPTIRPTSHPISTSPPPLLAAPRQLGRTTAMTLPSSPPILPTAMEIDPPSSPPLPALAVPPSRKRQFEFDLSSDPVFSEGTTDSEDGCDRPRRKRMVRGPWWSMGKRPQRDGSVLNENSRNVDSGVWMGSDESDVSSASLLSNQRRLQALRVTPTPRVVAKVGAIKATTTSMSRARQVEQVADNIINNCVEEGNESVDLSQLDLKTLSSETLRPLQQLIRHAQLSMMEPPSEDQFTALTPELKLFLAGNQLTRLPSELFLLENMTVLSVRSNLLPELPHSIGRLKLLKELNIAGNQIKYLPWELLDLLRSAKRVSIRPNPLIEIESLSTLAIPQSETTGEENMMSSSQEQADPISTRLHERLALGRSRHAERTAEYSLTGDESCEARQELIYLASSKVRYFDVAGTPCRGSGEDFAVVFDGLLSAASSLHRPPSLFELVLQRAQKDCDLSALPSGLPGSVLAGLCKAAEAVDVGNQECTTCKRGFIIPRATWMEFWFRGPPTQRELSSDAVLPFLRTACSWACAEPTAAGGFR